MSKVSIITSGLFVILLLSMFCFAQEYIPVSANTDIAKIGENQYRASISAYTVNYQDSSDVWRKINPTIQHFDPQRKQ